MPTLCRNLSATICYGDPIKSIRFCRQVNRLLGFHSPFGLPKNKQLTMANMGATATGSSIAISNISGSFQAMAFARLTVDIDRIVRHFRNKSNDMPAKCPSSNSGWPLPASLSPNNSQFRFRWISFRFCIWASWEPISHYLLVVGMRTEMM